MKMIFVDAENVGLRELEKINASVVDKVFVFSKSDSVKLVCEKSLYLFLSDYPTGQIYRWRVRFQTKTNLHS